MLAYLRLQDELRAWRSAGRRAILWWRDDDARGPSERLLRLLEISDLGQVPLSLAVIPDQGVKALPPLLSERPWVSLIQHGVDHRNRRDGSCAGEFPASASDAVMQTLLCQSGSVLEGLPGRLAVFAPPWNDVHPRLLPVLQSCGYRGLSAWGQIHEPGGARLDVHLDLLRWRGGARFRGRARFWAALAHELAVRRKNSLWRAPIGLLTHHLSHEERAWRFLESFVNWSRNRPEFIWEKLGHLLAA
ncbi:MAG: polysaccharide deacetylase [Caulobacteraceae bacterium]|nr:polysaccharide deacetylase [Caulobacteraceae bacterium]